MTSSKPRNRRVVSPDEYGGSWAVGWHFDDGMRVWVKYPDRVRWLEYPVPGAARFLPESFEVRIERSRRIPYDVQLGFDVEDGRPVCAYARADRRDLAAARPGKGVASDALRRIPVGELLDLAIACALHDDQPDARARGPRVRRRKKPPSLRDLTQTLQRGVRAGELTAAHFRRVADVYRSAPRAPTKTVAMQFFVPYSTASRWVSEARKRGVLGPTERGRAGETTRSRRRK